MIIVIEGTEGTGKTTLAKALSAKHDAIIYRAYRDDNEVRLTESDARRWRYLGFHINSYQEEINTMDLLRALSRGRQKPRLILDRSMPSALAYHELLNGTPESTWVYEQVWAEWYKRAIDCDVRMVRLTADPIAVMKRRPDDERATPARLERLNTLVRRWVDKWARRHGALTVNTTSFNTDQVLDTVSDYLSVPPAGSGAAR
jgi:deoxyadenosine/deoxycytidine kinase